ncbi:hypothetical protein KRX11_01035 [Pasteurellaceae bacterium TAE3-ERU1]|nr:hypothetical protein [Pasteurellaceae bacterium TAE3-ERU1]
MLDLTLFKEAPLADKAEMLSALLDTHNKGLILLTRLSETRDTPAENYFLRVAQAEIMQVHADYLSQQFNEFWRAVRETRTTGGAK